MNCAVPTVPLETRWNWVELMVELMVELTVELMVELMAPMMELLFSLKISYKIRLPGSTPNPRFKLLLPTSFFSTPQRRHPSHQASQTSTTSRIAPER